MSSLTIAYLILRSIPVLTAVLFGMLSVWAVQARSPWWARLAVICAALAAVWHVADLLPAAWYAFGTAFFIAGLSILRRRQVRAESKSQGLAAPPFWTRISLRDLLLLTAGVGIVLAIGVNAPTVRPETWLGDILFSWAFAMAGLACCWIALGRARWQVRAIAAPFALPVAVGLIALCSRLAAAFSFSISQQRIRSLSIEQTWQDFLRRMGNSWNSFFEEWLGAILCGSVAFCAWLLAARAAGWLVWPARPIELQAARPRYSSRSVLAAALSLAIAALPFYFAGRWVFRPALPALSAQELSLYQELVALGEKMIAKDGGDNGAWFNLSDEQFRQKLARDDVELKRFREIIEAGCRFPWREPGSDHKDRYSLVVPALTLDLRMNHGGATGSLHERIDACIETKRLLLAEQATSGFGGCVYPELGLKPDRDLWSMRSKMTAQQCREVVEFLEQCERDREPWDEVAARDRRLKEHLNARSRASQIAQELSGCTAASKSQYNMTFALVPRLVLGELAVRLFELESGRLPNTLEELTPAVLSTLPEDPYGGGPLCYQRTNSGYLLYSVGPNGTDDGGQYKVAPRPSFDWLADITLNGLYPPTPIPPPLAAPPAARSNAAASDEKSKAEKAATSDASGK